MMVAHGYRRDRDAVKGMGFDPALTRRVLGFARPYRTKLLAFVGIVVISAVVAVIPPLLFRHLIDEAIPRADGRAVNLLALGAVGIALASAALSVAQRWLSVVVGEGLIYDLRVALFDHVQHMPLAFFTRTQTGALISRLNTDVVGAQQAVTGTLGTVVSNIIAVVVTLTTMLVLAPLLTVATLVVLPAFLVPARRIGKRLQRIAREQMERNASMSSLMTERFNVSGALLVKLFGRHPEEVRTFAGQASDVRDAGVRSALYARALFVALGLVGAVGTAVVYWIGGHAVIRGDMALGTLVAFAAYTARIYDPLASLTNARVEVLTALVSFERVFEVLDIPQAIADSDDAADLASPRPDIAFEHVSFRYPAPETVTIPSLEAGAGETSRSPEAAAVAGDDPVAGPAEAAGSDLVLDDVSFTVAPGELVALVGPSGAGKTTIASLVPRLYDVTGGRVLVGGADVRSLRLASLRASIGVVTQDPHLFHDTIAANLRYARPGASDAELVEACRRARIHEVIARLPDGYDTVVGERGYRLSGGEKQRVAIARVLLKDPAIVILDEATSHLDAESEQAIQQALATALAGRSALVIAHRLSTIVAADRIVVVDDGKIVEEGRHHELVGARGLYSTLYRTQLVDRAAPLEAVPGPAAAEPA